MKLQVENDKRLAGYAGSGSLLGAAFMAYALTCHYVIPPILYPDPPPGNNAHGNDTIIVKAPTNYHGLIHHGNIVKHPSHPAPGERQAAVARTPHLSEQSGTLRHNLIGSRSDRSDYTAMDLIGKTLGHLDLDKLSEVGTLTRTGATRLSGRRGKTSEAFNESFIQGGKGNGNDFDIGGDPGGRPLAIRDLKVKEPSTRREIVEMQSQENLRSSAAILAVVRSHAPGLRHIYNGFLRLHPGLRGKVSLVFAIAPSGRVIDAGLAGSTTGAEDFDSQVLAQVREWRFDPVSAVGNDEVTVPFSFSE